MMKHTSHCTTTVRVSLMPLHAISPRSYPSSPQRVTKERALTSNCEAKTVQMVDVPRWHRSRSPNRAVSGGGTRTFLSPPLRWWE